MERPFNTGRLLDRAVPAALLIVTLLVLLRTMVPTFYTGDSGEFVIGAKTLGIVHAPGYPLYLLLLHLFLQLPYDTGWLANLFSTLCLAFTAPVLYLALRQLVPMGVSACATLIFIWSYYIWVNGLYAEIYTPQILALAVCLLLGVRLLRTSPPSSRLSLALGAVFGLAAALNPTSLFFVPGMIVLYRAARIPWRWCITAGIVAAIVFLVPLLYFPLRYSPALPLNLAGNFDHVGVFQPVDLRTLEGILWMLSGQQFNDLFFADGLLPSPAQLIEVVRLYLSNFLGFGFVLGLIGLGSLFRQCRRGFWLWLAFFLPVTAFYTTYGASDKAFMFGTSFLVWAVALGFGLRWLTEQIPGRWRSVVLVGMPLILLVVNFPLLDLSHDTSVRERSEQFMAAAPEDALVFGQWTQIVPLQVLHILETQRSDLTLYNLFQFPTGNASALIERALSDGQTVLVLDDAMPDFLDHRQFTFRRLMGSAGEDDSPHNMDVIQVFLR
ncbi:MAG: DUF2723 domain-containing protein [bacterium]|nr:DUF2723 domain-containing protein [bacterium]